LKLVEPLFFSRTVSGSIEVAWDVVSDMAGFGDAAPSLSKVEVVEGAGEGMHRRCYDSRGRGWDEVCTVWEEGRRYAMRVKTETYPFPLRQMFRGFSGAWEVEPVTGGTLITMRYETDLSRLGGALRPLIRRMFARQCEAILDNWQREIESRAQSATNA
jgi:Polyketide cyclase / dehydrase and lipid transport